MGKKIITFQKFPDIASARELTDLLQQNEIPFEIEDNGSDIPSNLIGSNPSNQLHVKVLQNDFPLVHSLLEASLNEEIKNVDPDYHLFSFTDEELTEIILKQDEWSKLDFLLAKKILNERGIPVSGKFIEVIKDQRIQELSKKEKGPVTWKILGYIMAFLGGIIGIIIGFQLATHKRTLPNGDRVYVYEENDRQHGWVIAGIGVLMFCAGIYLRVTDQLHFFSRQ